MTPYKQIPLFAFLLLLLFSVDKILANYGSDNELYIIRATGNGGQLVLDGTDPPHVKLQHFTGYSSQLWQFKRGSKAGLYYIINNETRNAVDDLISKNSHYVIMSNLADTLRQQWTLNANGRIVNAAARLNIDIQAADYSAGKALILVYENGNQAQEFELLRLGELQSNLNKACQYLLR